MRGVNLHYCSMMVVTSQYCTRKQSRGLELISGFWVRPVAPLRLLRIRSFPTKIQDDDLDFGGLSGLKLSSDARRRRIGLTRYELRLWCPVFQMQLQNLTRLGFVCMLIRESRWDVTQIEVDMTPQTGGPRERCSLFSSGNRWRKWKLWIFEL